MDLLRVFMKLINLILILLVGLMIVACGSSQPDQDVAKMIGGDPEAKAKYDAAQEAKQDAEQELINFECTLPGNQKFYVYKGSMKSSTPNGDVWIVDDKVYAKIDLGGKTYLMEQEGMGHDISLEDARDAYRVSKMTPGYDCKLGAVSASDVQLPNLEKISGDELEEKLMDDMMEQYQ